MKKIFFLPAFLFLLLGCLRLKPRTVALPAGLQIKSTPELVRRGDYLANHVFACMDCHSRRDFNLYSGPIAPGSLGMGGMEFGRKEGVPARVFVTNLTPSGIGTYSDEVLFRAITGGIGADGKTLFPVMPYLNYGKADPEDIKAIIAYLRTLKPIPNEPPASRVRFPVNWVVNTFPAPPQPVRRPDTSETLQYGRYLTTMAGCGDCHTPRKAGRSDESRAFTGGSTMGLPTGGKVRAPNLTPDPATGLGAWSREAFVGRFKAMSLKNGYQPFEVQKDGVQTNMPWTMYADMKEQDLAAIYEYLHSLKPVRHTVVRFSPPKS